LKFLAGVFALAFAFHATCAGAEPKPIWLAVGRPGLVDALEPLAAKRRDEGFEARISTETVEAALEQCPDGPDFLLLVGDDQPDAAEQAWYLPAKRLPLYRWREVQRRQFASDAAWGDLDGDLVPDIPVGRIPARRPEQVRHVVGKILAYERQPPCLGDLTVPVWLASPSYGPAIDAVATGMGLTMLRTKAPPWLRPWVISGNLRDSFCGWPDDQPRAFTRQLKQGGLCSVLMGHANRQDFYSLKCDDRWVVYNASAASAELAAGPPASPTFVFSCESGDFAGPESCMAEAFLFLGGGPVATIAATTESHPLTNYFSAVCLLHSLGKGKRRLGPLWLDAQLRALKARDLLMELMLRDVEGKLEEQINVGKLRRDQLLMYALLGDPATRLRLPLSLEASVTRTGDTWHWRTVRPPGATRLEVGFRKRPPLQADLKVRPTEAEAARAALTAANDAFRFQPLTSMEKEIPWEGTLDRPGWLRLVATGPENLHVAVLKVE
jgi:hypothetical protein